MSEYLRVATFAADAGAIDAMVAEIGRSDGPPEGVPAIGVRVLADRAAGKLLVAVRFASEGELRQGHAALEAMSPPSDMAERIRRTSVDVYEVLLDRELAGAGAR